MSLCGIARPRQGGRYGFLGCAGAGCGFVEGCCAGVCPAGTPLGAGPLGCDVAGRAVCGFVGTVFGAGLETSWRTEPPCSTLLSVRKTSAMAHTMNITAHQVVALDNTVAAP